MDQIACPPRVIEPAPEPAFASLALEAPDALLGLIAQFRADPRQGKIDLGVGVFRDEQGRTPVLRAVKAAEAHLLATQPSKSYLGPEGDQRFTDLLADIVFGEAAGSERLTGVQTPGGTGALRLGADLLARARPGATVWLSDPTWPNHAPIFRAAGLASRAHRFFDIASGTLLFDEMLADLTQAAAGDILLLHGCCHNPTGATLSQAQWRTLLAMCGERGLIPFIDLAYQGLGDGLDTDAGPARLAIETLPEVLVAYSCDKNFGLYRERVGALWAQGATAASAAAIRSNMLSLARVLWSMPPDHGAAVVRAILESPELTQDWRDELAAMRQRINGLRAALGAAHPKLAPIATQRGMFAMLPLSPPQVSALRAEHGVYMAGNGRINIAGLTPESIPAFVTALAPCLA